LRYRCWSQRLSRLDPDLVAMLGGHRTTHGGRTLCIFGEIVSPHHNIKDYSGDVATRIVCASRRCTDDGQHTTYISNSHLSCTRQRRACARTAAQHGAASVCCVCAPAGAAAAYLYHFTAYTFAPYSIACLNAAAHTPAAWQPPPPPGATATRLGWTLYFLYFPLIPRALPT